MPQTINKTNDLQIIAGVFSKQDDADQAVAAFRELGVPAQDLQVILQPKKGTEAEVYPTVLKARGLADSQIGYYDEALRDGKTFVAVHNVTDPSPVIEIFDRFGAESNPNGERNVRQDVAGMTAGVGAGVIAGAAAGLVAGGPVGALVGTAAGALVGGGVGSAAGKAVEHSK